MVRFRIPYKSSPSFFQVCIAQWGRQFLLTFTFPVQINGKEVEMAGELYCTKDTLVTELVKMIPNEAFRIVKHERVKAWRTYKDWVRVTDKLIEEVETRTKGATNVCDERRQNICSNGQSTNGTDGIKKAVPSGKAISYETGGL